MAKIVISALAVARAVVAVAVLAGIMAITGLSHPGHAAAPGQSEAAARRVALVIGNGRYPWAPLRTSVNDARDVAESLRGLGFQVLHGENTSRAELTRLVGEYAARSGSIGAVYYSGHAVQVDGRNYLIPVDAVVGSEAGIVREAIAADRLTAPGGSPDAVALVILDASWANPFEHVSGSPPGLAPMDPPDRTAVAYPAAPGQVVADGTGRNSVYAAELLRTLKEPGITVNDAVRLLRGAVAKATGGLQTPWDSSQVPDGAGLGLPASVAALPPVARVVQISPPPAPPPAVALAAPAPVATTPDAVEVPTVVPAAKDDTPPNTVAETVQARPSAPLLPAEPVVPAPAPAPAPVARVPAVSDAPASLTAEPVAIPAPAPAPSARTPPAVVAIPPTRGEDEAAAWTSVQDAADPAVYEDYLARFPNGAYAPMARAKLDALKKSQVAALAPAPQGTDALRQCPLEGAAAAGSDEAAVCRKCHSFEAGKASRPTGPNLAGIFRAPAGSVGDYRHYSDGMKAAASGGVSWTADRLDEYLRDPRAFLENVTGQADVKHNMFFKLPDDVKRAQVIAYMAAIAACK